MRHQVINRRQSKRTRLRIQHPRSLQFRAIFRHFMRRQPRVNPPATRRRNVSVNRVRYKTSNQNRHISNPSSNLRNPRVVKVPYIRRALRYLATQDHVLFNRSKDLSRHTATDVHFRASTSSTSTRQAIRERQRIASLANRAITSQRSLAIASSHTTSTSVTQRVRRKINTVRTVRRIHAHANVSQGLHSNNRLHLVTQNGIVPSRGIRHNRVSVLPARVTNRRRPLIKNSRTQRHAQSTHSSTSFQFRVLDRHLNRNIGLTRCSIQLSTTRINVRPFIPRCIIISIRDRTSVTINISLRTSTTRLTTSRRRQHKQTPVTNQILQLALLSSTHVSRRQRRRQRHHLNRPNLLNGVHSTRQPKNAR